MIIRYKEEKSKQRLDKYLNQQLSISRSQIQKLIKTGNILVNNQTVVVHHWLKPNDKIKIDNQELAKLDITKKVEANPKVKYKIVYEDKDYLIINKPAGLLVHPTEQYEQNTLVNGLLADYPSIKNVGENKLRPGIVHRLDKNVSGLMIVALTQTAFDYYKQLFKTRKMTKIYTALVHGHMEKPIDLIDLPIIRSKNSNKMVVRPKSQGGKRALTKYNVINQYKNFALLEVQIMTGRTHQIRTHLNALNHPVVGDPLYKQKKVKQNIELDRIFLHASKLGFKDQQNQKQEFTSKLPLKLSKIIKNLK